ncbi:MAG TPA: class I SAM-dependent methyltransferase [Burkholderiaceae bacterium]|nr:class I SAM-dependent methyltransferase [Burkholderiaceae bacterium]
MTDDDWTALARAASALYRPAGRFAHGFARGKLRGDPAFRTIVERGLLASHERLLDLGCGQALFAALAHVLRGPRRGKHPTHTSTPWSYTGIELMRSDAERARRALGTRADIVCADIRSTTFPDCDAVIILDVLHYLPHEDQLKVLQRVRAALSPHGVLLLRVGDADAGWRFKASVWVDRVVTAIRGHRASPLHVRGLTQWRELVESLGFRVETCPMSRGTPFANVLLIARPVRVAG